MSIIIDAINGITQAGWTMLDRKDGYDLKPN